MFSEFASSLAMMLLSGVLLVAGSSMLPIDIARFDSTITPDYLTAHIIFRIICLIIAVYLLFIAKTRKVTSRDFCIFFITGMAYSFEGTAINSAYCFAYIQVVAGIALFSTIASRALIITLPISGLIYLAVLMIYFRLGLTTQTATVDNSIAIIITSLGGSATVALREYWSSVHKNLIDRQLTANAKLIDLGRHLGMFSHDIGNLLGILKMQIQLMRSDSQNGKWDAAITRLNVTTEHLITMRNFILSMAREKDLKVELISGEDLAETINAMLPHIAFDARSYLSINIDKTHTYRCSATAITLALANAVSNSVQAAQQTLPAQTHKLSIQIDIHLDPNTQDMVATVQDNGPGFPLDVLPKLFKESVSTKLDVGGSGLGLRNLALYVEQQGGQVRAYNQNGAVIEMRIPQKVLGKSA